MSKRILSKRRKNTQRMKTRRMKTRRLKTRRMKTMRLKTKRMKTNRMNNTYRYKNKYGGNNINNINDPTLYYFYMNGCGWCKKFNPVWDELTNCNHEINIKQGNMEKINGPENNNLTTEYKVNGYPTIILVKNNKRNTYEGNRELEELKRWILSC